MKSALITGCSPGGIGEALVRAFRDKGFYVFATLRNVEKAGALRQLSNVEVLPLEVTSTESIRAAAAAVAKHTGGSLDVLVNNAGADFVMPLLDVDIDAAKHLFDVNVWSILATTQVFVPLLVAAEGEGAVLNITSTAAVLSFAYAGIYSSSKAAASQISETLRIELAPLGVRVLTGLLGAVHTPIHVNAGPLQLPPTSYYRAVEETIRQQRAGELKPGALPPDVVAQRLVRDVLGGKTGTLWRGGFATIIRLLRAVSPWLLEYMVNQDKKLEVVKTSQAARQ